MNLLGCSIVVKVVVVEVVVVEVVVVGVVVFVTSSTSTFLRMPLVDPFLTVIVIMKLFPEELDVIFRFLTFFVCLGFLQMALDLLGPFKITLVPW